MPASRQPLGRTPFESTGWKRVKPDRGRYNAAHPGLASFEAFQALASSSPPVQRLAELQRAADKGISPEQALIDAHHARPELQQQRASSRDRPDAAERNQTGLPDTIGRRSGMSVTRMAAHEISGKPASLQMQSLAEGHAIHAAPDHEQHLSRKAPQVVQQAQERMWPTAKSGSIAVNVDRAPEAERNGATALAPSHSITQNCTAVSRKRDLLGSTALSSEPLQMQGKEEDDAKQLTWSEWLWKYKWTLLTIGVVSAAAAYVIYKKYGGQDSSGPGPEGATLPPSPDALASGEGATLSPPAETLASAPMASASGETPEVYHAWTPGKEYTIYDKVEGLVGLAPGGGLVVEGVKQILSGEMEKSKLMAEIIKAHPYAIVPRFYDGISVALSYYSSGQVELGTTAHMIATLIEQAKKYAGEST